mmetsp:Transcript_25579/g.33461  ORF Transcript_25579/g.33461 Transcript_25579/m.33461 type:complete len:352 (+) Transcript_25579:135-1190(+)
MPCCIKLKFCRFRMKLKRKKSRYVAPIRDFDGTSQSKPIQNVWKILLLGIENAGKSTIFRQLNHVHGEGSARNRDRKFMVSEIHRQILMKIRTLCSKLPESEISGAMMEVLHIDEYSCINADVANLIKTVFTENFESWKHDDFFTSLNHFIISIDRISQPNYIPSHEDLLHLRVPTVGVRTAKINVNGYAIEMYDVGGQTNERRKWIHFFDDVSAVTFIASLSDYDQYYTGDQTTNKLVRSMEVFSEVCHNKYLSQAPIVIFLNKVDLFSEKLKTKHISSVPEFSSFNSPKRNVAAGLKYFTYLFLQSNSSPTRRIYCHATCGIDADNIKKVFDISLEAILQHALDSFGLV